MPAGIRRGRRGCRLEPLLCWAKLRLAIASRRLPTRYDKPFQGWRFTLASILHGTWCGMRGVGRIVMGSGRPAGGPPHGEGPAGPVGIVGLGIVAVGRRGRLVVGPGLGRRCSSKEIITGSSTGEGTSWSFMIRIFLKGCQGSAIPDKTGNRANCGTSKSNLSALLQLTRHSLPSTRSRGAATERRPADAQTTDRRSRGSELRGGSSAPA